ncbi:MAG TPA: hypothetical protein VNS46_05395 [Nocardioides sp.]|nr:hypothetical protein [Nocardioides sp.]
MATSDAGGSGVRWWRRSRDLAQQQARAAHADATQAMRHLESLEVDLTELSEIHAASAAAQAGVDRIGFTTPLSQEWDRISVETGIPALQFYELDAAYDARVDHEEDEARRITAGFTAAAARLRELFPEVERFRAVHADALAAALAIREDTPGIVERAEATRTEASLALAAASRQDLRDGAAADALVRASTLLGTARTAADERRWVDAHTAASEALRTAETARTLATELPERAERVRTGHLSVRTRRDAIRTQQARLPEVMSQLRRRYTVDAWRSVDGAPERVAAALKQVEEGLAELDRMVVQRPLDVPAATELLAAVRTAVNDANEDLRAATDRLQRLDSLAEDPQVLLDRLRRRLVDARRFVAALPAADAGRYGPTLDGLARRTEDLREQVGATRPDWGAVIAEADAVEAGLDAMIRTARGH